MCFGVCFYAICCAGSAVCNCCCKGLKACGVPAKNWPKAAYVATDMLFMVIATTLMYTLRPLFKDNEDWVECNDSSGGGYECFGTSAVYRASFVLFLYHIMILLILIPRGTCASALHDGFFTLKLIVLFAAYIASFWMPNDFFIGWANFCRGGSVLYLLLQGYFLLNFAYLWNDTLWEAQGKDECYAKFMLCGFSIILSIVCSVWIGFQFAWYSGCALGNIVLVITILAFLVFYTISLLKLCDVAIFRPNATIFVVGFVNTYIVYMSWTAMASHPDKECNDMIDSDVNTFMQILIGAIFCFINIWSIAVASATDSAGKEKTSMGQAYIEEDAEGDKNVDEEKMLFPVTFQTMFFHGIMCLCSLYFGMLFTNWGYAILDEVDDYASNAHFSVWAKLISQWITIFLFAISVSLYVCDKNRVV